MKASHTRSVDVSAGRSFQVQYSCTSTFAVESQNLVLINHPIISNLSTKHVSSWVDMDLKKIGDGQHPIKQKRGEIGDISWKHGHDEYQLPSSPIIRMDAILILMENLNRVEHVQFFSKTCRGPEVTVTFMVLLDILRLISRYEETWYYGQSFHNIKWWMIWVTNMDAFMMFYERICLSVYHPYQGKITTIHQWEASAVWKGFPVHFATIVWPNWMVLKVLIHYYPYRWMKYHFRCHGFPTVAKSYISNWSKFSQ